MICRTEDLERAAAILRAGGLVAFPTETVYGLGANAFDAAAVAKIFEAKERPATSPLIVHVATFEMASEVVAVWPEEAEVLARHFWPGPLTLVLPKKPSIPDVVTSGLPTVGVRMPNHPTALALIAHAGFPIAAPSANLFTRVSPTTALHVSEMLGARVGMILDGGPSQVGIESTVLSLTIPGRPVLLRPGGLVRSEIEALIGPLETSEGVAEGAHQSPGQHRKHYSPKTPLYLTDQPKSAGVGYLWWSKPKKAQRSLQMPAEPEAYAQRLYAALHTLDAFGLESIAVEPVPDTAVWAAVRDRLMRSSAR